MIKIRGKPQLYQWEIDRQVSLTCSGVDELLWSIPSLSEAIRIAHNSDNIATIPNELLQVAEEITVYAQKDDQVVDSAKFGVEARPKPSDYVYTPSEILNYETLANELENLKTSGGATDEQIENAIKKYLAENPMPSGSTAKISYVELLADKWQGEESPYSQVVEIEGATVNSQVDLTPDVEQLSIFYNKDLTFTTTNINGVITVYVIGQKPQNDYTIQVTLTEVRR